MRPTTAFVLTVALWALGQVPLPNGQARLWRQSARSLQPARVDRDAEAAGYYEGLIDVGAGPTRTELAQKLLGKPRSWLNFNDLRASRSLPGDFLQFELRPDFAGKTVGAKPFTTNAHGMRDQLYSVAKPSGVFRIALLGASIDMGWGIGDDETYESLLETWLNQHARRRGLERRFEVLNFAMAAYSPLHRLESFRRKALAFEPDLVLYSGTLLDPRLIQLHVTTLIDNRVPIPDGFVLNALRANLHSALGEATTPKSRELAKSRLPQRLWPLIDAAFGALAAECRTRNLPLWCVLIPRAGDSDLPDVRPPDVARYAAIAHRYGIPLLDLTAAFDDEDPATVEVAPWDDHPNAHGHALLFRTLADRIVADEQLYHQLFDSTGETPTARFQETDSKLRRTDSSGQTATRKPR